MELQFISALEKVFSEDSALPAAPAALTLFGGERGSVQLCVKSDRTEKISVTAECALPLKLFRVEEIPAGHTIAPGTKRCTLVKNGRPGLYPDLLRPFSGALTVRKGKTSVVWILLDAADLPAGSYALTCTVAAETASQTLSLPVKIADTRLLPQTLLHTDWFHADCLASYYNVEAFGEAHWKIVERFMENAANHGVNLLLTPLFTPPLDTAVGGERPTVQLVEVTKKGRRYTFGFDRLFRWITLAGKHGVEYFEFSHFFTQWGAKHAPKIMAQTSKGEQRIFGWETDALSQGYRSFLMQLGAALKEFTDDMGITDRCFVHCSDEPGEKDLRQYEKVSAVIKAAFPAYRQLDALSDFDFYERGLVETPVPGEGAVPAFAGKVPKLWTYYCCGQFEDELPNRFFAMPSVRNRILGVLLYKYDCEGFLHWGYNFYYTQFSKREVDPFTETDAGGAFPAGDSFAVYPGENGEPLTSLRQQVFYDGLQDLRALRTVEALTSRETVLKLIEDVLGDVDFSHYPMDPARFFLFREKLAALVG